MQNDGHTHPRFFAIRALNPSGVVGAQNDRGKAADRGHLEPTPPNEFGGCAAKSRAIHCAGWFATDETK
jgi:hypothetical protein